MTLFAAREEDTVAIRPTKKRSLNNANDMLQSFAMHSAIFVKISGATTSVDLPPGKSARNHDAFRSWKAGK